MYCKLIDVISTIVILLFAYRWVQTKPERSMEFVDLPVAQTNPKFGMTTIPFLMDHYGEDETSYAGTYNLIRKLIYIRYTNLCVLAELLFSHELFFYG